MNPSKPTNSPAGIDALVAQRLLDGRQVGNGGRELANIGGAEERGFASLLKTAQQQSAPPQKSDPLSQSQPRQASTQAAAQPKPFSEPRRAEPPREPSHERPRPTATAKSVEPRTKVDEEDRAPAEAAPAEAAPETPPNAVNPQKAKPRALAVPPVAATLPSAPGAPGALPETAANALAQVKAAPGLVNEDLGTEEPALGLPVGLDQAIGAALPTAKPLDPAATGTVSAAEGAAQTEDLLDAPGLAVGGQAPSNALPPAPARRASASLTVDANKPSSLEATPSSKAETIKPADLAKAAAVEEKFASGDLQPMAAPNPVAAPVVAVPNVQPTVKEPRGAAEAPVETPTVKGSLSLSGWASAPAPGLHTAPASSSVATVASPLTSPAFADELSAQVAVWTRNGVQEAELRMNPAEMGPVQVRIQLDGQVAQVRFVAEQAPTREALQAALPQLVQALAAEGLQWGGGDVQSQLQQNMQQNAQQQAAQQGQQQAENQRGSDGHRQWRNATGLSAEPQGPQRLPGQRVGLLDLYA